MNTLFPRFFVRLKLGGKLFIRSAQELRIGSTATLIGGTAATLYLSQNVNADIFDRSKTEQLQVLTDHKLTKRELRFLQFASIEYDDVIYMSPMDFIDSLTLDAPRERVYRRVVKEKELQQMLKNTPPFRRGESKSAFKIAFLIFDEDNNNQIEKDEFLLIRSLMSSLRSTRKIVDNEGVLTDSPSPCQLDASDFHFAVDCLHSRLITGTDHFSLIFTISKMFARNPPLLESRLVLVSLPIQLDLGTKSEEEVKKQNTTLLMHLFGLRGTQKLSFDEFQLFYQNLQEELMEIEFHEFSRGKANISPVDFARLILRYTIVNKEDYAVYIQRVHERTSPDDVGVNLDQWALFSIFLNNLGEFQTAVRLYTNADMPVTKPEFSRAVQCTIGKELHPVIVDLIFRIFDANRDGTLSYSEFLGVMNDRLHRGLRGRLDRNWGWKTYKSCVISELARQ